MRLMICLLLLSFAAVASSSQYIFPKNGQSEEQQAKDLAECDAFASKQTGGDLAALEKQKADKLAQIAANPPVAPGGAGAKGAAAGAAMGSLAGRDKLRTETAVAGALIGGAKAKKQAAAQASQALAQANAGVEAEYKAAKDEYFKARSVCLETLGYNVK
ncbi:hypothetical protein SAMN02745866_02181 [Alteromonadaceae bacterium Bs31]|nr:hypothetical protein SAMN02745866_02181 [Alteromonadaceae bacterium Bs31]